MAKQVRLKIHDTKKDLEVTLIIAFALIAFFFITHIIQGRIVQFVLYVYSAAAVLYGFRSRFKQVSVNSGGLTVHNIRTKKYLFKDMEKYTVFNSMIFSGGGVRDFGQVEPDLVLYMKNNQQVDVDLMEYDMNEVKNFVKVFETNFADSRKTLL